MISLSKKLKRFSVLFFVLALVFIIPSVSRVRGAESEAASRVSQAEDSLKAAYLSVLEAERVGGDVSELVAFLNTALEYYSEAERALELGEYETTVIQAGKVIEISKVVLEANVSLMVVAEHIEEIGLWNQLLLSIGFVCFITLFGFLSWRRFKGYYIRRMVEHRIEVVADESR